MTSEQRSPGAPTTPRASEVDDHLNRRVASEPSSGELEPQVLPNEPGKQGRRFLVLPISAPPHNALLWSSAGSRRTALHRWRRAVITTFAERSRLLRICWTLESLFTVKT